MGYAIVVRRSLWPSASFGVDRIHTAQRAMTSRGGDRLPWYVTSRFVRAAWSFMAATSRGVIGTNRDGAGLVRWPWRSPLRMSSMKRAPGRRHRTAGEGSRAQAPAARFAKRQRVERELRQPARVQRLLELLIDEQDVHPRVGLAVKSTESDGVPFPRPPILSRF